MITKREQVLIERLKASGRKVHTEQFDSPLMFMVRPFTTVGVDVDQLASLFENETLSIIKTLNFESPIKGILVFPTIIDGTLAKVPTDYVKHKTREKTVFVGRNISYDCWSEALEGQRVELLAENIRGSIRMIPRKYLAERDQVKLLTVIDRGLPRVRAKLLH